MMTTQSFETTLRILLSHDTLESTLNAGTSSFRSESNSMAVDLVSHPLPPLITDYMYEYLQFFIGCIYEFLKKKTKNLE